MISIKNSEIVTSFSKRIKEKVRFDYFFLNKVFHGSIALRPELEMEYSYFVCCIRVINKKNAPTGAFSNPSGFLSQQIFELVKGIPVI